MKNNEKALINVSKKTFIQVTVLLLSLMIAAIVLTYIIPRGQFGTLENGETNYLDYSRTEDGSGINILKGIFAPVLVFTSSDGITLIMLSLFLLVISAAFQVMNDAGGISALIGYVSERFRNRKTLLIIAVAFVFMCFGAFLGLFEEMLTMLPIVTTLCVFIGFDSFTGFLISIIACGFGFASAITNPFTVILASQIIKTNPMEHVWYRFVIFFVMFLLLLGFIFFYIRKIKKDPGSSLTFARDERLRADLSAPDAGPAPDGVKKTRIVYTVFLLLSLVLIIVASSVAALRGYTVVILLAYFLILGPVAGIICTSKPGAVFKSFLKGLLGALPTLVFIALASSIKYIFEEGSIMPTIIHGINEFAEGKNVFVVALVIYAVVLVLEFFISSSTAKAVLVMGILSVVNVGLTKQMSVLLYTFADGYTNVLFPTSPVLLISLSMIGLDYFKWVKKSLPLFIANLALVLAFIVLGIVIGY